ncbi:hypothetical protein BZL30_5678 [Mycobacterium kansasii]|uniref:Uncharacterized protein n=1 Tax=Mycobacterium kansasii TaxID=1768 RepID=A0A1V3WYH7_MYCKA|nr:hypothetical protein BZL30_5678 [Mycobacterium kansasii]
MPWRDCHGTCLNSCIRSTFPAAWTATGSWATTFTHKHPASNRWLVKYPKLPLEFRADLLVIAQPAPANEADR